MNPSDTPRINVLVVDDDEDTSALLGLVCGRQGWRTLFASDLAGAIKALETAEIAALITDVNLPDGRGLSLLENRRASLRAAVVISGRGGAEELSESTRAGFDAYLVKPFDAVALVSLIKGLLAPPALAPIVRDAPSEDQR
jgi:DNA-binding response OmpR family regulator